MSTVGYTGVRLYETARHDYTLIYTPSFHRITNNVHLWMRSADRREGGTDKESPGVAVDAAAPLSFRKL